MTNEIQAELEQSRVSAARLLESLALKLRAVRPVNQTVDYLQSHSPREMAAGVGRLVRRRPVYAVVAAVVAGLLVGSAVRALQSRRVRAS